MRFLLCCLVLLLLVVAVLFLYDLVVFGGFAVMFRGCVCDLLLLDGC